MTAAIRRRLAVVEEVADRRMRQHIAEAYGIDAGELVAETRRLDAEVARLRLRGLSEQDVWRGMLAWVAADVGVSETELEAECVATSTVIAVARGLRS